MLPPAGNSHTMRPSPFASEIADSSAHDPCLEKTLPCWAQRAALGEMRWKLSLIRGVSCVPRVLSAHNNVDLLRDQAARFRPRWVVVTDPEKAGRIDRSALPEGVELLVGREGIARAVGDAEIDMVLSAIVGSAGLQGTWAALEAGKPVALANKESLVMAGPLVMRLAEEKQVTILPVDSEHNAVFQAMQSGRRRRGAAGDSHRQRGAVSHSDDRAVGGSVGGRGPGPPHLGYGAESHHRFGDPHEQGLGDYRGPLALQYCQPADRGDDSSAIDRTFDGRICGWLGDCPVKSPGHEAADPVRPDVARALPRGGIAGRLAEGDAPRFRTARFPAVRRLGAWPGSCPHWAARRGRS